MKLAGYPGVLSHKLQNSCFPKIYVKESNTRNIKTYLLFVSYKNGLIRSNASKVVSENCFLDGGVLLSTFYGRKIEPGEHLPKRQHDIFIQKNCKSTTKYGFYYAKYTKPVLLFASLLCDIYMETISKPYSTPIQ